MLQNVLALDCENLRKKKKKEKKKAKKDKKAKEVRDVVAMALLAEIVNCQMDRDGRDCKLPGKQNGKAKIRFLRE